MQKFDGIDDYKPQSVIRPKPFEDRDDRKERRNKAKEKRICISLVILTFLASVCVLFGTLFPELSRGEIDMEKFRGLIGTAKRLQPHLIKDKITIVNLGLWRYCYDDQLYDLIELVNPAYAGRRRRSAEEHSLEKRAGFNKMREGDLSVRCHSVPEPWKMPYHVKNKTEATKVCLLIGIVMCIVSFLISILVLITRLPILKLLQLLCCFLGVASIGVALGLCASMWNDAEFYFNEALGRVIDDILREEFRIDIASMGIVLKSTELVQMRVGISSIFVGSAGFLMLINIFLAELARNTITR